MKKQMSEKVTLLKLPFSILTQENLDKIQIDSIKLADQPAGVLVIVWDQDGFVATATTIDFKDGISLTDIATIHPSRVNKLARVARKPYKLLPLSTIVNTEIFFPLG
jgi:hypothetical protein